MKVNQIKQHSQAETAGRRPQYTAQAESLRPGRPIGLDGLALQFQQMYGNQFVQRLLRTGAIQAKLAISEPGDLYEQEADRVSDHVMRMPDSDADDSHQVPVRVLGRSIQRVCQECEEEIQRQPAPGGKQKESQASDHGSIRSVEAGPQVEAQIHAVRGGGRPLTDSVRAFFEPRFGYDFSQVRVHTDAKAAESAQSINARAYTLGRDIIFGEGQFAPESSRGLHLLAHELTHVLQQGAAETVRGQSTEDEPDSDSDSDKEMEDLEKKIESREAPSFGDSTKETCPKGNVQLGKVEPDPPCEEDRSPESDESWLSFEFCQGSDVFRDQASAGRIRQFARNKPALASFTLHAYASVEGTKRENDNLSCHRARRVERELLNAGALPEKIEIKGKGQTSKFDITPKNRLRGDNLRANRRVALNADTSNIPPKPELPPPEREPEDLPSEERLKRFERRQRQMVDTAIAILTSGHYRLAADAYMARWTCGEFRTLRDAVARTEVRIQGEPAIGGKPEAGGLSGGLSGMETEKEPFDIVILNQAVFNTFDPLGCIIARIIDLTFHLKAKSHLADRDQRHRGGVFLVELAGFIPCADIKRDAPGGIRFWFSQNRPTSDPLVNEPLPSCAEKPLEGAWVSEKEAKEKGHDLGGKKPLVFSASTPLSVADSIEPAAFRADLQTNRAFLGTAGDQDGRPRVLASTSVAAEGDLALFPRYRLGFIRTVQDDKTVVEYTNGFQLQRRMPTPLRDGSTSDPAPWFDADSLREPGPPEAPSNLESAAPPTPPQLEFPFAILTHPTVTFRPGGNGPQPAVDQPGRLPIDPLAENVVSRVQRHVLYTLWSAARREDAPLDRSSTHFVEAHQVTVQENVDVRISPTGAVLHSGDASVSGRDAGPGLEPFARLDGPVPAAFAAGGPGFALGDRRIVTREMSPDRDLAPLGLDRSKYRERVVELTTPIRQDLGLTQLLKMRIVVDPDTGRMWAPGIRGRKGTGLGEAELIMILPVEVLAPGQDDKQDPFASRSALGILAERFYMEGRSELVLRRGTSEQEKKLGDLIILDLPALPGKPKSFPHLHQIPGALTFFHEVWTDFAKDCLLERTATIIVDRRNNNLRRVFRVGDPPRIVDGQIRHHSTVCLDPSEKGDNRLNVHETVLGSVHSHPKGIPPSNDDYDVVREMEGKESRSGKTPAPGIHERLAEQRFCGNDLYVLLRAASGDVIALRVGTEEVKNVNLGPILGKIGGCK